MHGMMASEPQNAVTTMEAKMNDMPMMSEGSSMPGMGPEPRSMSLIGRAQVIPMPALDMGNQLYDMDACMVAAEKFCGNEIASVKLSQASADSKADLESCLDKNIVAIESICNIKPPRVHPSPGFFGSWFSNRAPCRRSSDGDDNLDLPPCPSHRHKHHHHHHDEDDDDDDDDKKDDNDHDMPDYQHGHRRHRCARGVLVGAASVMFVGAAVVGVRRKLRKMRERNDQTTVDAQLVHVVPMHYQPLMEKQGAPAVPVGQIV